MTFSSKNDSRKAKQTKKNCEVTEVVGTLQRLMKPDGTVTKIPFSVFWSWRMWTKSLIFISLTIKTCLPTEVVMSEPIFFGFSCQNPFSCPTQRAYILLSWSPLSALVCSSIWFHFGTIVWFSERILQNAAEKCFILHSHSDADECVQWHRTATFITLTVMFVALRSPLDITHRSRETNVSVGVWNNKTVVFKLSAISQYRSLQTRYA